MNSILFFFNQIQTGNGIFFSQVTYWFIGTFAIFAIILGTLQLIRRFTYSSKTLADNLSEYARNSGINDEMVLYNYVDNYFLNKFLPYDEIIRFLISSLIVLGLLGTFVGLATLIIPNFKELANIMGHENNTGISFENVLSLITEGFATAFLTSIIGIISALVCSFFYQIYRHNIKVIMSLFLTNNMPSIVRATKKSNVPYDPVEFYKEIQNYFMNGIKEFGELTLESNENLRKWASEVIKNNTEMVREYVEANNTKIQAVIDELGKEYTALNKSTKDNLQVSKILDQVVGKLDAFADVIRNYDTTYELLFNQIEDFSQNFSNLFTKINSVVEKTSQPSQLLSNLYTSIQEMVNNQNLIYNSNQEFYTQTHDKFSSLIKDNGENNQLLIQDIRTSLAIFENSLKESLSKQAMDELLSPQTSQILKGLTDIRDKAVEMGSNSSLASETITKIFENIIFLNESVNNLETKVGQVNNVSDQVNKINRNLEKVYKNFEAIYNG